MRIRHLALAIAAGVVVVLAAIAAALWFLVFRSQASPVSLGSALGTYRKHGHPSPAPHRLPPVGVYVYNTSGYEQLSLPGTHRSWPSTTTITVTGHGCGEDLRWAPLAQHVETDWACPGPGNAMYWKSSTATVRFFGITTSHTLKCDQGAYLRPPKAPPGQSWRFSCGGSGETWHVVGHTVGVQDLKVGGTKVPTVHVHFDISVGGSETGTSPTDYWFARSSSKIVRAESATDVSQGSSPLGPVKYQDRYRLEITSLTPRR